MGRDARGVDLAGVLRVVLDLTERKPKRSPRISGDEVRKILEAVGYLNYSPDYDYMDGTGCTDLTEEEEFVCDELRTYCGAEDFRGMLIGRGRPRWETQAYELWVDLHYLFLFSRVLREYWAHAKRRNNAELGRLLAYIRHRGLLSKEIPVSDGFYEDCAGFTRRFRGQWSARQIRDAANLSLTEWMKMKYSPSFEDTERLYEERVGPEAREEFETYCKGWGNRKIP